MNCTSCVRSEIKINFGHQGFAYLRQKFLKIREANQEERRNFHWSTNYTSIQGPRLQYKIKYYTQKRLGGI